MHRLTLLLIIVLVPAFAAAEEFKQIKWFRHDVSLKDYETRVRCYACGYKQGFRECCRFCGGEGFLEDVAAADGYDPLRLEKVGGKTVMVYGLRLPDPLTQEITSWDDEKIVKFDNRFYRILESKPAKAEYKQVEGFASPLVLMEIHDFHFARAMRSHESFGKTRDCGFCDSDSGDCKYCRNTGRIDTKAVFNDFVKERKISLAMLFYDQGIETASGLSFEYDPYHDIFTDPLTAAEGRRKMHLKKVLKEQSHDRYVQKNAQDARKALWQLRQGMAIEEKRRLAQKLQAERQRQIALQQRPKLKYLKSSKDIYQGIANGINIYTGMLKVGDAYAEKNPNSKFGNFWNSLSSPNAGPSYGTYAGVGSTSNSGSATPATPANNGGKSTSSGDGATTSSKSHTFTVRLLQSNGSPWRGATLKAHIDGGSNSSNTDSNGYARFPISAGFHNVKVYFNGKLLKHGSWSHSDSKPWELSP